MTIKEALEVLRKEYGCRTAIDNDCISFGSTCDGCEHYVDTDTITEALKTVLDAFGNGSEIPNSSSTDTNVRAYDWIPCKDKMPDPNQLVLMQCRGRKWPSGYRYFQTLGVWIPPLTVKAEDKWTQDYDTEELEVYDEDTDTYYCEAGWYEETTQGDGDNMSWKMNADVIAWMPLPVTYKGGADEGQTD